MLLRSLLVLFAVALPLSGSGLAAADAAPAQACWDACEERAGRARGRCRAACARAIAACQQEEARDAVSSCSVTVVWSETGPAEIPELSVGRPADLALLRPAERAVVAEADARAPALRARPLVVHVGSQGTELRVVQTRHGFRFGFPIDLKRFGDPESLDFYERITRDHFGLAVIENNAKWAKVEPEPGVREHADADADLAWAEALGFEAKGHTLLWGIVPPFSSSGVPAWAVERYGAAPTGLDPAEKEELRGIVRSHVLDLVSRYRGRLSTWDVTNEMLQPVAQWFIQALGPSIVNDAFHWAHEADPDATLVYNEWIVEVFTGFQHPTAADVRDRVLELLAQGVPVHAVGQQAHFTPALAFTGVPVDLSRRTGIRRYATALDTLAEAGLPIHITETNFIAPDEPELRAAHAEALMRLWWGHPSVEQVVFWGPWNRVAGRDEFDVGFWDDDGALTRHGEAVLSLLNDRWRTDLTAPAGPRGRVALQAHLGDYVAEWQNRGRVMHAKFRVQAGEGAAHVVIVEP